MASIILQWKSPHTHTCWYSYYAFKNESEKRRSFLGFFNFRIYSKCCRLNRSQQLVYTTIFVFRPKQWDCVKYFFIKGKIASSQVVSYLQLVDQHSVVYWLTLIEQDDWWLSQKSADTCCNQCVRWWKKVWRSWLRILMFIVINYWWDLILKTVRGAVNIKYYLRYN